MKKLVSLLIGGVLLFGAATLGMQSVTAQARQDQNKMQNRREDDRNNRRRRHRRRHHRRHRRHKGHHADKLSY